MPSLRLYSLEMGDCSRVTSQRPTDGLALKKPKEFFFFIFCVLQLYLWGLPFWVRILRM